MENKECYYILDSNRKPIILVAATAPNICPIDSKEYTDNGCVVLHSYQYEPNMQLIETITDSGEVLCFLGSEAKLRQISNWVAIAITSGFISQASGTKCVYDSETEDQNNIKTMYIASQDPTFDTDATYQGKIPFRAIPEAETKKTIVYLNKSQIQTLVSDLARHIGWCKLRGWQLQAAVATATTQEELEGITW